MDEDAGDTSARAARDRFFETLTSFVDPFFDPAEVGSAADRLEFSYAVRAWNGEAPRLIVSDERQFDRRLLDGMEHQLVGSIDADGVFRGRVKAFGQWVQDVCVFEPPKDLVIPRRADTHRVVAADGPERIHGEWWRRAGEVWAVALRCLLHHCPERWPLLSFWDSAGADNDIGRAQGCTAGFNSIVRQLRQSGRHPALDH